ncbi:MAG: hypothetical protein IMZ67_03830 [Acidobacteria bacterium]|nr:hypothetical protein [Acidobacteriota bacterium]
MLIIDDDVELCKLIVRFLGREGLEVEAVQAGHQGIERPLSGDYALIVLDVTLMELPLLSSADHGAITRVTETFDPRSVQEPAS